MADDSTLRVDAATMQRSAQALHSAAEDLRARLTDLDGHVGALLEGWRGGSGNAYASAWELWHRGAGEVEAGLSMLAQLLAHAGGLYQQNEATSARAMREVGRG